MMSTSNNPRLLVRFTTILSRLFSSSSLGPYIPSTYLRHRVQDIPSTLLRPFLPHAQLPSKLDVRVIEDRQVAHRVSGMYAVECPAESQSQTPFHRCRYGYPRAYVQFPLGRRPCSGMIRLSCPHLVKEIDRWEKEGAIEEINRMLVDCQDLVHDFKMTNERFARLRRAATTDKEFDIFVEKMGPETTEAFMNSGIIGISPDKLNDIKCVHAHVADFLLTGQNKIGKLALDVLQKQRNVDPSGCAQCHQQCNVHVPWDKVQWKYMSAKNKSKLRQQKLRRKEIKDVRTLKLLRAREKEEIRKDASPNV